MARKKPNEREMPPKRSVSVRELSKYSGDILHQIRVNGIEIEITDRGKVIAKLIPVRPYETTLKENSAVWTDLDNLAAEIGARWPKNTSAVDAVRDERRDL